MTRARWIGFALLAVVTYGAACPANTCDVRGCDAIAQAVASPTISQGIAGFAATKSDVCEAGFLWSDGCCECPLSGATLFVFSTAAPVKDEDEANRVVALSDAEEITFDAKGYEEHLAPGAYLACAGDDEVGPSMCAPLTVEAGRVTSVHARFSTPGRGVYVMAPDGTVGEQRFTLSLGEVGDPCNEDDDCVGARCSATGACEDAAP